MTTKNAYITEFATSMPNEPVTNENIENVLGKVMNIPSRTRSIILRNNGIKQRHYAIDPKTGLSTHTNAQLGANAIRELLRKKKMTADEVNLISLGTASPDLIIPSHAVMVHGELGTPATELMSSAGSCSASVGALKYAYQSVLCGHSKNAIIGASEVISSSLRGSFYEAEVGSYDANLELRPELAFEKDFLRWMLSDGAAAAMVQPEPNLNGISLRIDWIDLLSFAGDMSTCMYAGGLQQPDGSIVGYRNAPNASDILKKSYLAVKQDAAFLNKSITDLCAGRGLKMIAAKRELKPDGIDWFLPHLSSEYFRKKTYESLVKIGFEIPNEKWFTNLSQKGNTASAAILIMLDELFYSGNLKVGDRILCAVPESARFSVGFFHLTVV